MKDILKKGFYLGLGAATLTKEKANKALKVLVKKGIISGKESKKLVSGVLKEASKEKKRLHSLAKQEAKKALKEIGVVSVKECKRLKKRLNYLEKELRKGAKKVARKVK